MVSTMDFFILAFASQSIAHLFFFDSYSLNTYTLETLLLVVTTWTHIHKCNGKFYINYKFLISNLVPLTLNVFYNSLNFGHVVIECLIIL
jgi:hypothetical protein